MLAPPADQTPERRAALAEQDAGDADPAFLHSDPAISRGSGRRRADLYITLRLSSFSHANVAESPQLQSGDEEEIGGEGKDGMALLLLSGTATVRRRRSRGGHEGRGWNTRADMSGASVRRSERGEQRGRGEGACGR